MEKWKTFWGVLFLRSFSKHFIEIWNTELNVTTHKIKVVTWNQLTVFWFYHSKTGGPQWHITETHKDYRTSCTCQMFIPPPKESLLKIYIRMFYSFLQLLIWQNSFTPGLRLNGTFGYSGVLKFCNWNFNSVTFFQWKGFSEQVIKSIK